MEQVYYGQMGFTTQTARSCAGCFGGGLIEPSSQWKSRLLRAISIWQYRDPLQKQPVTAHLPVLKDLQSRAAVREVQPYRDRVHPRRGGRRYLDGGVLDENVPRLQMADSHTQRVALSQHHHRVAQQMHKDGDRSRRRAVQPPVSGHFQRVAGPQVAVADFVAEEGHVAGRSEEHTSELQSPTNL